MLFSALGVFFAPTLSAENTVTSTQYTVVSAGTSNIDLFSFLAEVNTGEEETENKENKETFKKLVALTSANLTVNTGLNTQEISTLQAISSILLNAETQAPRYIRYCTLKIPS